MNFPLAPHPPKGLISYEEFRQTWKLLSSHLKTEISDDVIANLAQCIDFNKDGSIDINEFMEAFRLVDLSAHSWEDGPGAGAAPAEMLEGLCLRFTLMHNHEKFNSWGY